MKPEEFENYDVTTWRPRLGITFERAIAEAIIVSSGAKKPFTFKLNDHEVSVEPIPLTPGPAAEDSDFGRLADEQLAKCLAKIAAEDKAKVDAYLASPQYEIGRLERATEIVRRQNAVNRLTAQLADVCRQGDRALLKWAAQLADVGDDVGVRIDLKYIIRRLKRFGWRSNAHVGRTNWPNKRVVAEFIVGQVIYAAEIGMPPHPMTGTFVEQYLER